MKLPWRRSGAVGEAYENVLYESFFATLERVAIFDFVEGWYNPKRHSALD